MSDNKLIFSYITLDFQCFKTELTTVLQMGIFTALIH